MSRFIKPLSTAVLLSLLFMVVYSTCNWLTSLRSDVGSIYFSWERHIPFVPLMVIPYMSLDLFFFAAPFLAAGDQERRVLASRITAAVLVSGACFLLFPLQYAFERPYVEGALGLIFNPFRSIDLPFNEFPSLHVTLRTILADFYARRTRRVLGVALAIWFSLIGLSTLFTHQHHVIDVVGGFALGALCCYLICETGKAQPVVRAPRIAAYYLCAAFLLAVAAATVRPWSLILLWPALSFALVAMAYLGKARNVFRKHNGRIPWSTWAVLWPVLVGQKLSLWYYSRQCAPWDRVHEFVWIGRRLSTAEATRARDAGVMAVIDLAGEFTEPRPFVEARYLALPVLDLTRPTTDQLDCAISFIRESVTNGEIVYIHCKAGYSRTVAVAGAWLLADGHASSVDEGLCWLRRSRPSIVVRDEIVAALQEYYSLRIASKRRGPARQVALSP